MVKPKNKHSLSHVRHDPAHCLAPGLFRALKRGERKRSKLDVTYDYGDGKRIEFSGPEPLGADDLRILQGLVAMAGPNGLVLGPEPKTEGGRQLRLILVVERMLLVNLYDRLEHTSVNGKCFSCRSVKGYFGVRSGFVRESKANKLTGK